MQINIRSLLANALTAVLMLTLASCSQQEPIEELPEILKIGILPDENPEVLIKKYTPLFKYLSNELGVPYELKVSNNYNNLLKKFENREIDLAYFGGFTFLQAHQHSHAVPIVMRDIDVHFTSYFITRKDSHLKSITDYKNKNFSFGSKLSTSGHLMPRYYLMEKKILAETYFSSVKYSGSHDKTAYWVRDGLVDIGAVNSIIIDKMLTDGRLNHEEISIIWETPPYPDYVWAFQSYYSDNAKQQIRNAFLSLTPANKQHFEILQNLNSGGFLPASTTDFSKLEEVASKIDLLKEASVD